MVKEIGVFGGYEIERYGIPESVVPPSSFMPELLLIIFRGDLSTVHMVALENVDPCQQELVDSLLDGHHSPPAFRANRLAWERMRQEKKLCEDEEAIPGDEGGAIDNREEDDSLGERFLVFTGEFEGKRHVVLVKGRRVTLPPQPFKILLYLAVQVARGKRNGVSSEDLVREDLCPSDLVCQTISRLRRHLRESFSAEGFDPKTFISVHLSQGNNGPAGYVELKLDPSQVSFRKNNLQRPPHQEFVRNLAKEIPLGSILPD